MKCLYDECGNWVFRHSFELMNLLNFLLSGEKIYINGRKNTYSVAFCCAIFSAYNFQFNELSNLRLKKRYGSSQTSTLAPSGGNETNAIWNAARFASNALHREKNYKIQSSPWNFKHIGCDGQMTHIHIFPTVGQIILKASILLRKLNSAWIPWFMTVLVYLCYAGNVHMECYRKFYLKWLIW